MLKRPPSEQDAARPSRRLTSGILNFTRRNNSSNPSGRSYRSGRNKPMVAGSKQSFFSEGGMVRGCEPTQTSGKGFRGEF